MSSPGSTSSSPSLAGRALLALLLMIGFYGLAIAIAAGLLYIPYAEYTYAHRLHIKIAIFCVFGAGVILFSILPRWERFQPPGPRLDPAKHPKLFREIHSVARAVGQPMPAEVYLVPDVNAWVSERGGMMGFGGQRIMGLGLPLLQILKVSELRAVLAHEFGHYHGGDTRLGPWIYHTRAAIGRTLQGLREHSSVLQAPFEWYGKLFLRISHAVSRRQEFTADALAANAVGARPLVSSLRTIHHVAPAFDAYLNSELATPLKAGFRPPLAEGFDRFIKAEPIAKLIASQKEDEAEADPYDTHPPLKDRIAAVNGMPLGPEPADEAYAVSLLSQVPELEGELLTSMLSQSPEEGLKPLHWEEVGEKVYVPQWQKLVEGQGETLRGQTPSRLPSTKEGLVAFGKRVIGQNAGDVPAGEAQRAAVTVLGAAFAVALHRLGWQVDAPPGLPVALLKGEQRIEPFNIVQELGTGELSAERWQQRGAELGIGEIDLSGASKPASIPLA